MAALVAQASLIFWRREDRVLKCRISGLLYLLEARFSGLYCTGCKKLGAATGCTLAPDPVCLVSFSLTYVMDWQSLEEAGAVHPDPHSDNILLQRMGQRVWTDLGRRADFNHEVMQEVGVVISGRFCPSCKRILTG